MYSGGCVSACPLRWHSLHLIWSCFSWGHVVHCTFVLCVHIEYKIVQQEACSVGNYPLKCRFCFQRAYIVLLLHNPAILEKGTCDRIYMSGFGTKTFPSIFMQHNLFYFWKSTVLREWIDFCHCFQSWETVVPCIFYFRKKMTLFLNRNLWIYSVLSESATTTFGAIWNHLATRWELILAQGTLIMNLSLPWRFFIPAPLVWDQ